MPITGVAQLNRKLLALPDMARREIAKAMEASATDIVNMAKSLAPVDDGDLRDSIGWTWGDAPRGAMVLGEVRGSKKSNMQITIYAGDERAFWARWVEFGTAPHAQGGRFEGTVHPGNPAQPFFYPAYRATRRKAKGRITRAITKSAKMAAAAS